MRLDSLGDGDLRQRVAVHERLVVSLGGREVVKVELLVLQNCGTCACQPVYVVNRTRPHTFALLRHDRSIASGERHGSDVVVRLVRSRRVRRTSVYLSILGSCQAGSNQP